MKISEPLASSPSVAMPLARWWRSLAADHSLRKHVAKSVTFQTFGNVAAQGCSFLTLLIVAHLLGKEQYGRFALVQSTVVTFTNIGSLGLGITASKYVSEFRARQPQRLGGILGLSSAVALLAALIFAAAYGLSCGYLVGPEYAGTVRLGMIAILFTALNGYQLGALAGFEAFTALARISIVAAVLNPPVAALLTHFFGLGGAVMGLGATAAIQWMLCQITLAAECKKWHCSLRYQGIWSEGRVLLSISAPASLSGVVGSLGVWLSSFMLSKQPGGLSHLALFSAANSLRSIVLFLPLILLRVMMPRLNFFRANAQPEKCREVFWMFVATTAGISTAIGLVLAIGSQPILALFGKGFLDPDRVVPVLMLSTVIEAVAGSLSQSLVIQGRMWRQVLIMGTWSVLLLASLWKTVHFGALGLALANLTAWSVALLMYLRLAQLPPDEVLEEKKGDRGE